MPGQKTIDVVRDDLIGKKETVSLEEVNQLADVFKDVDQKTVESVDGKFETALNAATFSKIFEGIKSLIKPEMSSDMQIALQNLVVGLWKYDKKSESLQKDPKEYMAILTSIIGSGNQSLNTAELDYKNIKNQYEKMQETLSNAQNLLNKYIIWNELMNSNANSKFIQGNFVESFKKDMQNNTSLSNRFDHLDPAPTTANDCVSFLQKTVNAFQIGIEKVKNGVTISHESLQKVENDIKSKSEMAKLLAEMNGLSLEEVKDPKQTERIKNLALDGISKLAEAKLPFGTSSVKKILNQTKSEIENAKPELLASLVRTKFAEARKLCESYESIGKVLGPILDSIDKQLDAVIDKKNVVSGLSSITMDQYLNTSDNLSDKEIRDAMLELPQYEQAFNQVFDTLADNKGALNPAKTKTFLAIIGAENLDELTFSYVDKYGTNPNALEGVLSIYPQGTRVITIKKKGVKEYVTFGKDDDINQLLAKGFSENTEELENIFKKNENGISKCSTLFDVPTKNEKPDFEQFSGKMNIAVYGGPEALQVLFQKNGDEFKSYLKEEGNLKKVLDNVLKDPDGKSEKYLLSMISGIKSDKTLMLSYLNLLKDVNGSKYLGKNLLTQQLITEQISKLIEGPSPMFSQTIDSQVYTQILSLKATVDIQLVGVNKPKSLEDQVKMYVGILFQHPIGKMLLKFLDSFFDGKAGLLKRFGKIPGFEDALNKQFEKDYKLKEAQQIDVLTKFDFKEISNDPNLLINLQDITADANGKTIYLQKLANITKTFSEKNKDANRKKVIDNFFSGGVLKENVLDVDLLSGYYLANKESLKDVVAFDNIFSVDGKTKAITLKAGISYDNISPLLDAVLQDKLTHTAVSGADQMLKGHPNNFGQDKNNFGISDQIDYGKALAAYLMGGSRGERRFHYLLSENNIGSERPKQVEQVQKPENTNEKIKTEFEANKKTLMDNLGKISDLKKYGDYDFNDSKKPYAYSNKPSSGQISYETDILKSMKLLVQTESSFKFLLDLGKNSDLLKKENFVHLKNLFIYENKGAKDVQFNSDVIDNIALMDKVENKDNNTLVFSNGSGKIKLSFDSQIKASYEKIGTV